MYPDIRCSVVLTVDVLGNAGDSSESDDDIFSMPHLVVSFLLSIIFKLLSFTFGKSDLTGEVGGFRVFVGGLCSIYWN